MFADLDDALSTTFEARPTRVRVRETFPCQSCGGTGVYRGVRTRQMESKCFPCGGKGHFITSQADRMKARADANKRKFSKVETARAGFEQSFPGFASTLADVARFSSFARDLQTQLNERGALTERQVAAVRSMAAKAAATVATRNAEREDAQAKRNSAVDLSPIHAMFNKAQESGLKKLAYRAEGLVLSLAKQGSANPGAIYVKTKSGEYLGKVITNVFRATSAAAPEHKEALQVIASDPAEAATRYGKRVGECSCCGRELTDPDSIAAGIGPVCATKWGF